MAADNCNIQPGDTVAIWGAGPVGQFAVKSAFMLGAEKVIVLTIIKTGSILRKPTAKMSKR
jgi:threonine dehydrogenase-like Zn-dependent dehydrogenase